MRLLRQAFRAGRKRRHPLIATLVALCLALPVAAADRPRAGLMWNRSGLPLAFPLILKTAPGEDVFVTLTAVGAEQPAMAAYARGGEFFRVLVPPGTFNLSFAAGTDWQGEATLFGPGDATRQFDLGEPLTFEVRGFSTKAGHVVDLTGAAPGILANADIDVRDIALCQITTRRAPASDYAARLDLDPGSDRRYARGDGPIGANRTDGPIGAQRGDDGPLGAVPFGVRDGDLRRPGERFGDGFDVHEVICG